MVRGDVYLFCSQLVELSRTFSHFLLSGRMLNVGRLLRFLPWCLTMEVSHGGRMPFLNALGGARCPRQQLRAAPSPHLHPIPGSKLKAAKGEEVEENWPESQALKGNPNLHLSTLTSPPGERGGRGGRRVGAVEKERGWRWGLGGGETWHASLRVRSKVLTGNPAPGQEHCTLFT